MIMHILRIWLRPIFGRALGTSGKEYKSPSDVQTIGGGGGGPGNRYGRKSRGYLGTPVTSNIRFSNSEERIVDEMKMQDMNVKTITESEPDSTTTAAPSPSPVPGIYVSNRVEVSEEGSHGDMQRVHEAC